MKKLFFILMTATAVYGQGILGLSDGYESMIQPHKLVYQEHSAQLFALAEFADEVTAFDPDSKEVNVLQLYEPSQNLIGLFQGTTQHNTFTELINSIAAGPGGGTADAYYTPTGSMKAGQVLFGVTYALSDYFSVQATVPIRYAKLYDVSWKYTGNLHLFADQLIANEVISSFESNVKSLFNLDLTGWSQTGFGDLSALVHYEQPFKQYKKYLKQVTAHFHMGLTFPTGKQGDVNTLMPMDFDYDGAYGLPFGGGLDLDLGKVVQVGFRADFWHYFSNQKLRRVKAFGSQTSLLMSKVAQVWKNYGFIQQFTLFAQLKNFYKGFSAKVSYDYYRKGIDTVSLQDSSLDWLTINASAELDEQTRHHVLLSLMYDALYETDIACRPQFELFVKIPFNGSRSVLASTVGILCSLDF